MLSEGEQIREVMNTSLGLRYCNSTTYTVEGNLEILEVPLCLFCGSQAVTIPVSVAAWLTGNMH